MSYWISPLCYGCGMCVPSCPRGAIHPSKGYMAAFEISSLDCNDCAKCTIVCPVAAIGPDPDWAMCRSRGCPLAGRRYGTWACTEAGQRCPTCGGSLWKAPDADVWACAYCDPDIRVACPKIRKHLADGPDSHTAEGTAEHPGA